MLKDTKNFEPGHSRYTVELELTANEMKTLRNSWNNWKFFGNNPKLSFFFNRLANFIPSNNIIWTDEDSRLKSTKTITYSANFPVITKTPSILSKLTSFIDSPKYTCTITVESFPPVEQFWDSEFYNKDRPWTKDPMTRNLPKFMTIQSHDFQEDEVREVPKQSRNVSRSFTLIEGGA